jgi:hypothetical protein
MSKVKKNEFVNFVNEQLLTLMTDGFKPDLKDMFKTSDIDVHCPDLESAFFEAEDTGDLFEAVRNHLAGIKNDFIVHLNIDVSDSRKRTIIERSSSKKIDSLDMDDILDDLNNGSEKALQYVFGK